MALWVRDVQGGLVNLDHCVSIREEEDGFTGTFTVETYNATDNAKFVLFETKDGAESNAFMCNLVTTLDQRRQFVLPES